MGIFSKNNENSDTQFIYTNSEFPLKYQINSISDMIMNGQSINKTETSIIWQVNKWIANDEGYAVDITAEKSKTIQCPPPLVKLSEFLKIFNFPLSKLSLQLNKKGSPIKVYNQEEVFESWQYIKEKEMAGYEEDETTQAIIYGGNSDFSDTLPVLNNSFLYLLFFSPVYGNKKITTPKFQVISQDSHFFHGNNIKIRMDEKIVALSNREIKIEHEGYGDINDYGKAEKFFKKSYKPMTDAPFDHDYFIKAHYKYSADGKLINCQATVKEQACKHLISEQTYSINLIQ